MPLDIDLFRKERGGDPEKVRESQRRRMAGKDPELAKAAVDLVDEIIEWDLKWRTAIENHNACRKQQRIASKNYGKLAGKLNKSKKDPTDEEKAQLEDLRAKAKKIKEVDVVEADKQEAICIKERNSRLHLVGNIVSDDVPVSNDEEHNAVVRTWGTPPKEAGRRHHHELLWMIGGYEPDMGTTVAGHRGYFLTGPGVRLNLALQQYSLDFLSKRGYTPVYAPFFMKKDMMGLTAELADYDDALYHVKGSGDEEYYLIATSEQPISAMYHKKWMKKEELPKKFAGMSTCFRKEAGSSGKDCWGIFRVHQFEKIEQFVYTAPGESKQAHEDMMDCACDFYKSLGFPYRVVAIVSGELNNAAAKKYDLEAWFPTLQVYRELVSASNCTDYQARAMETRYGQSVTKGPGVMRVKQYVHMLNATLCATSRTICCILENYQQDDGVRVPTVLQPYMGGVDFLPYTRPPPDNKTKHKQAMSKAKKGH